MSGLTRYVNDAIFREYLSVMLLSYSISSGALGSLDLLLSYSMIALALHNTTILIIPIFQP